MTDNRTTELLDGLRNVGNLHEFAELFGFDWHDDSDWTWHDVAVKMADDFEQAIAATLGSGTCEACAFSKTTDLTDGCAALERIAELEEECDQLREAVAYWQRMYEEQIGVRR